MASEPQQEEQNVYVELKKLPSFSTLNEKVRAVEQQSTWMERYGYQWTHILAAVLASGIGLLLLRQGGLTANVLGFFLLGAGNVVLTHNSGHLASHGALGGSKAWNKFWCVFFIEFMGSFSEELGVDIHIRNHHPHTNIIGLGDSSSWKAPSLPRLVYLYPAPLVLPAITPLVSIQLLIKEKMTHALWRYIPIMLIGIAARVWLFVSVCDYTVIQSLLAIWLLQATFSIPYIHINIFQHIGLPMYSVKNRPVRIYQMATGVLNLERNLLLDYTFGHSLVNCHVEHHLFPRLTDYMCLKVKPLVRQYLLENGLPYNEKPYHERLGFFMKSYEKLMVDLPSITHFIGLQ